MLISTLVLVTALASPVQVAMLGDTQMTTQESATSIPAPPAPPSAPQPPTPPAAVASVPQPPPAPPAPAAAVSARVAPVARTPQTPKTPPAPAAPPAPATPAVPATPPAPPAARELVQLVNVQVEVSVSDQVGSAPPVVRTVTATAADGQRSSVRSQSSVKTATGFQPIMLALDVRPQLTGTSKVRVEIGLDTNAVNMEAASKDVTSLPMSKISQSVVLESGRSVVLSQTTDPLTDRKTTIEVKATILR